MIITSKRQQHASHEAQVMAQVVAAPLPLALNVGIIGKWGDNKVAGA
jgi:hypothetical protein